MVVLSARQLGLRSLRLRCLSAIGLRAWLGVWSVALETDILGWSEEGGGRHATLLGSPSDDCGIEREGHGEGWWERHSNLCWLVAAVRERALLHCCLDWEHKPPVDWGMVHT